MYYVTTRMSVIARRTRWGWHFRFYYGNHIGMAYSKTFGWHVKVGRFVRARTRY